MRLYSVVCLCVLSDPTWQHHCQAWVSHLWSQEASLTDVNGDKIMCVCVCVCVCVCACVCVWVCGQAQEAL